jgi:hypothetical protein
VVIRVVLEEIVETLGHSPDVLVVKADCSASPSLNPMMFVMKAEEVVEDVYVSSKQFY